MVGIPVFVFKSYFQSKLSLEWRQWMTQELLRDYFSDRTFYQLQVGGGGTTGGWRIHVMPFSHRNIWQWDCTEI